MKYAYTILYVENVEESLQFYENAFGFNRKFITPEKDYGELNTGETTIAFASFELGSVNFQHGFAKITPISQPPGIEMALVSDNIEEDFQQALDAGAEVFEKIVQKPWGQKVGYVRDNSGFLIEICTPIHSGNESP